MPDSYGHKRVRDENTGRTGEYYCTHAACWFVPDDGGRDELDRVIREMVDEDTHNLIPFETPQDKRVAKGMDYLSGKGKRQPISANRWAGFGS